MIDNCEIRIAHPDNPRSWLFTACDYLNTINLEFSSHPYSIKNGKTLEINCEESGSGYGGSVQLFLTLPQAKKMREFLDHFIKTEDVNG